MSPVPTLRPVRTGDAADVLAVFGTPGMERQGSVRTLEQAREFTGLVTRDETSWANPRTLDRAVFAIDLDGALIGVVGVSQIDRTEQTGWFWYWLHGEHRGRGWVSSAAAIVADWALDQAGVQRLELGHRADNPASAGVARAAGFVEEGTERAKFLIDGCRVDVWTYGRLPGDPRPPTARLDLVLNASRWAR